MQDFNYHTHTARCKHAVGTDEEYVIQAINANIKHLGFSDHAPFKELVDYYDRMNYGQIDDYLSSIHSLAQKYQDQIEIIVGYEAEYYPNYDAHYQDLLSRCDYLVLGQHYALVNGQDFGLGCSDEELDQYCELLCQGMKSGYFKYVAHPDYFMLARDSWNEACERTAYKIAKCAKECNLPLEINLKGKLYGTHLVNGKRIISYPNHRMFEIISEVGTMCVFGQDTHDPLKFQNFANDIIEAKQFLGDLKLNINEDFRIVRE